MNRLAYPQKKTFPYIIVAIEYVLYVLLFTLSFDRVGWAIAPLTIIPVAAGSWYFGIKGGILTATLSVLTNM